ncbi:MAG: Holliday junction resolvase RuvX [Bacilli bacterium]|nr:Holliday junction resolvase RuvX [Bacilli bacterium]
MEKVIGLDLGTKTLGIAKSDVLGFVHGVETFRFPHKQFIIARKHVIELTKQLGIKEIALGYPLHLSGEQSEMSEMVLRFRDDLLEMDNTLNIHLVDERMSSVTANQSISLRGMNHDQRKENVDKIAACVILDTYIRSKENGHGTR